MFPHLLYHIYYDVNHSILLTTAMFPRECFPPKRPIRPHSFPLNTRELQRREQLWLILMNSGGFTTQSIGVRPNAVENQDKIVKKIKNKITYYTITLISLCLKIKKFFKLT